ncbi:MAG: PKD domain-containing protein [Saprospiraceae bacterium]
MKYRFFQLLCFIGCLGISFNLSGQTASETAGCAPLSVSFTAPTDATSFFWDFKDNATSQDANPTNTFVNPGVYEVTFSNEQGGAAIGTVTVNVYATPTLTIAQDPEIGCAPANIVLTNTTEIPDGIDLISTNWTFPDGTGASGISTEKDYAVAGQYAVNVQIVTSSTNCNAAADFTDFITVVRSPVAAFSTSPSPTACTGPHTVTFFNETQGTDLTYLWNFDNGNLSSEVNPPNQTYEDGSYDVSLTVTNEEGCFNTFVQKISVGLPIADFAIADTVCAGTDTQIQNISSEGAYTWTITGPNNFNSTAATPTYNFPTGGVYQIRLEVVAEGGACRNEIAKTVFSQDLNASFTANPTYSCQEPMTVTFTPNNPIEGAMYSWEFGDDSTSTDANPVHDYNADNESPYHPNGEFDFTAKLTMNTSVGCMAEFETDLLLDIPLARFMPDTVSGCAPLAVEFSDSSRSTQAITNWEWIYADGNTANFDNSDAHSYTYTEPGEYDAQLVITNSLGCPDTSYIIRVEVGERVGPDFSVDKLDACIGEPIQFTDMSENENIDEWHYYTDNDRSSHCFSEANPIITFETETGEFDATLVVGYNGCLDSISKTDVVNIRGPIAHIDYKMSCDTPNTVMFTSNSEGAMTISWDFGDMSTGTETTESHDYASTGNYQVILTAENTNTGCAISMDTALIQIRNIKADGPVDMLQCKGQPVMLNSASSTDVDTSCFRGYTWFFNEPSLRPVTTAKTEVQDISYPDTGMYQIDLVVEDVNGCVDTASYPIIVHEAVVSFDIDKTEVCSPQTVNISNVVATTTSESIETYMWDFGDGGGMSEEENPGSYTYSIDPGSDEITISVMIEDDAGCPGEASKTLDYYRPTSQLISGDLTICAGEGIMVRATEFNRNGENRPLSYSWSLGNGDEADTQAAETTYNEGGIYTIRLDFTEIATGCTGSAVATANVQDFPVAAFTTDVDGQDQLCAPAVVSFTDASESLVPLSQSWDFGNGGSGVGPTAQGAFSPGTFMVSLMVQTSNGCDDETTRDFTFEQGPEAVIQLSGTEFCIGEEVTATIINQSNVTGFSWEFEGMTFGENEETVNLTLSQIPLNGFAPIKLNLQGVSEGCNTAQQENVRVNAVVPAFEVSSEECESQVTFTNLTEGTVQSVWDFGDGGTSTDANPVYTYNTPGAYEVTLTATDLTTNCTNTTTQLISAGTIPTTGGFTAAVNECLNITLAVDAAFTSDFPTIEFDYGDGNTGGNLSYSYATPGNYTITLSGMSEAGCVSELITQTIEVSTMLPQDVGFSASQVGCSSVGLVLNNPNAISGFSIDYGDNSPQTTDLNYDYGRDGDYTITLTANNGNGCVITPVTQNIAIRASNVTTNDGETPKYVPNVFTPEASDMEGPNNLFKVSPFPLNNASDICRRVSRILSYNVYNRFGKLVYENTAAYTFPEVIDPDEDDQPGWNGTDNPNTIAGGAFYYPSAVYVYAIEVEFSNGETEILKGDVTLVR